jgi:membrane-associated phospholipid phosphatase
MPQKSSSKSNPAADKSMPEQADVAVAEAVAPYQETPLIRALSLFSKLGDQPPMRIISGSVLAIGLLGSNKRLATAGVRMLAAHTLATLAKDFIKDRVDRTRPEVLLEQGRYEMEAGDSEAEEDNSFPSGHSAGAVAVGRAFARDYPEHAIAAQSAAALIALGQIPRCKHYPTDVGAGSAIGFLSEWLVSKILR